MALIVVYDIGLRIKCNSTEIVNICRGIYPGSWGSGPTENMYEGSWYALTPINVTFFHSKLPLLDNSASFTIKDEIFFVCQKWKVRLISRGA